MRRDRLQYFHFADFWLPVVFGDVSHELPSQTRHGEHTSRDEITCDRGKPHSTWLSQDGYFGTKCI